MWTYAQAPRTEFSYLVHWDYLCMRWSLWRKGGYWLVQGQLNTRNLRISPDTRFMLGLLQKKSDQLKFVKRWPFLLLAHLVILLPYKWLVTVHLMFALTRNAKKMWVSGRKMMTTIRVLCLLVSTTGWSRWNIDFLCKVVISINMCFMMTNWVIIYNASIQ